MEIKGKFCVFCLLVVWLVSLAACQEAENRPVGSVAGTQQNATSEPANNVDSKIEQMENATLEYPGQNDEWKYNIYDCYVELTDYIGPIVETLVVPAEIEGLPVWKYNLTALDPSQINFDNSYYIDIPTDDVLAKSYRFYADSDFISPYLKLYCSQELKSVELPNCLLWIGPYAFFAQKNLSQINLPEDLCYIGDYAFSGCTSLAQVTLPNSIQVIERGVFCSANLTNVTLPEGLLKIGYAAFANNLLTEIIFPDSLTQIEPLAFYGCQLIEKATIPASVVSISESSFFGCGYQKGGLDITILGADTLILHDNTNINRVSTIIQADFSVLHGRTGSSAAIYCSEFGIPFQVITN